MPCQSFLDEQPINVHAYKTAVFLLLLLILPLLKFYAFQYKILQTLTRHTTSDVFLAIWVIELCPWNYILTALDVQHFLLPESTPS